MAQLALVRMSLTASFWLPAAWKKGCMYPVWICIALRKNEFINTYDIPVRGKR